MQNAGSARTWGVEAEIESRFENGVQGTLSLCLQTTTGASNDASAVNSPQRMVKGRLFLPIAEEILGAGLEAQYTSARTTIPGNRIGGVTLANLTLSSRELLPGLDLSAGAYNLFGKRYADPGSGIEPMESIPQDGLTCRLKATYGF
jgi:iron complex outermembrane receptor protein